MTVGAHFELRCTAVGGIVNWQRIDGRSPSLNSVVIVTNPSVHHFIQTVWSGSLLGGSSSLLDSSSVGNGYALLEIEVRDGGIQPEDAGLYECVVESDGFEPTSVTVEIIVLGKLGKSP